MNRYDDGQQSLALQGNLFGDPQPAMQLLVEPLFTANDVQLGSGTDLVVHASGKSC